MTTKNWSDQSGQTGTGSWYDDTNGWFANSVFVSHPTAGDGAVIFGGDVTISATDPSLTIDGVTIEFAYTGTGEIPTLDVLNQAFGAQTSIFTANRGDAALIARGTVSFAGTLTANASHALTIDIETGGTAPAIFTNTGLIEADRNLMITGAAGAVLDDKGTLLANFSQGAATISPATTIEAGASAGAQGGGHLLFAGNVTNSGTLYSGLITNGTASSGPVVITGSLVNSGQIAGENFGLFKATGGVDNKGTIVANGGGVTLGGGVLNQGVIFAPTLTLAPTGTLEIDGGLTNAAGALLTIAGQTVNVQGSASNAGGITLASEAAFGVAGVLAFGSALSNSGQIVVGDTALASTLMVAGALANAGTIEASSGVLVVGGSVSGAGTVLVGVSATLAGAVAAGQVLDFTANNATLMLGDAGGFHGTITGLLEHDVIDLAGQAVTSASYDTTAHVLTLNDGTVQVAQFTLQGASPITSVNFGTDNAGGTVLTTESIGTPGSVESYIVGNDFETAVPNGMGGFNTADPHKWAGANPTITYSFDSSSNWSATEEAAFRQAMTIYSDIADITFLQTTGAQVADIDWVRAPNAILPNSLFPQHGAGEAETGYTEDTPGTVDSATIAIDTRVPGWENLGALGTADSNTLSGGGSADFGGYGYLTVLHELGHALGFGHPGPYNDSGPSSDTVQNYLASQTFYTDTRQYSVMSYLNADESGADWVYNGTTIYPQTPMLYDIGAIENIYGGNSAALTGGDTFGFNANFGSLDAGAHRIAAYNFAENTVPVVTLFDAGANNTLDLSGFGTNDTIDLNAGHFSDVDGLTDNLAIDYRTTIDTAKGGSGNDTFIVNADADTIDGGSGFNVAVFAGDMADYTFTHGPMNASVTRNSSGVVDTLSNIEQLTFADATVPLCFMQGTRILTARGEVPVQALRAGEDRVVTSDGRLAPVVWLGWREFDTRRHLRAAEVMPVRVRAHAIAPGLPRRDLLLSPDHALALHGALVPVRYLVNGATIVREEWQGRIGYFHVELDRHDVLLAEGLPAESYLDSGNRGAFANGGLATHLHPRFAPDAEAALAIWAQHACAPLLLAGPALVEIRAALLQRAEALGHALSENPRIEVQAGGRTLPLLRSTDRVRVHLPPRAQTVQLRSRVWSPLLMADISEDPRRLGIAVTDLRLGGRRLALDDARLAAGWHATEPQWRWTDGSATIRTHGTRVLEFRVAGTGRYWAAEDGAAVAASMGRRR